MLFYIAHLWTRLFEVAHNWMKLLQIGKILFDWWTSPKCFQLICMLLFSRKFDWSFSHLHRFNWRYFTLPKCSYFTQMFLILPKTLLKILVGPNVMKATRITTWFQFTQGQCLFAIKGKKEWQNSLRLFCRFGHYFAIDLVIVLPQFGK